MATIHGGSAGKGSAGMKLSGRVQLVDDSVHKQTLGVGLAATADESAWHSVLVQEGDLFPRIPVKVGDRLASGAFWMARLCGRRMTVLSDLNIEFVFFRSSVVVSVVKHALQLG